MPYPLYHRATQRVYPLGVACTLQAYITDICIQASRPLAKHQDTADTLDLATGSGSLSIRRFLGSTRFSIPNGISIGLAVFAQLMADSPNTFFNTLQWAPFPPEIARSRGVIWTPI